MKLIEKYTLISYADDLKPGVTSIEEISLCLPECSKLEASGVHLHRDPESGKVKILPLGRWRKTLNQTVSLIILSSCPNIYTMSGYNYLPII